MTNFVHLNTHSGYSILDGLASPKDLIKKAKEYGMEGIALTDLSNMYATIDFYKTARKEGLKPIIGSQINVVPKLERKEDNTLNIEDAYSVVLLAKNNEGYRYLMEIISKANVEGLNDEGRHTIPYVDEAYIAERTTGLIMLSGIDGKAGKKILEGKFEQAKESMNFWKNVFGDRHFMEITRTGRLIENDYIPNAVEMSIDLDIPIVATNSVRFLEKDDFLIHEARICIQESQKLEIRGFDTKYSPHQYFKSQEEMSELFADIPEALENTKAIFNSCNVELTLDQPSLPKFPIPNNSTESQYLSKISYEGLEKRLNIILSNIPENKKESVRKNYEERLNRELEVIDNMGFPGYFLIVADFIQWSKRNDIPVGPGRGSGAGSLVAYSCEITDIDPLPYDLLFERFLNPERVSMPDFDIDFCEIGRDRVIDYVSQRYGADAVSQISTFGTMAAKSSIRDTCRVMGFNYGFGDRLSKMISSDPGTTLTDSLKRNEYLKNDYDQKKDVKEVFDIALKLEGVPRSVGRHAAGVLISPSKLSDFTPVHNNGESYASHYSKDDVETAGLVKFDFLGLKNLTIIDNAVKSINKKKAFNNEAPLDISLLPMDDKASFNLLKEANTTAVFQLESNGMKGLIKKLQPDNFEEIIALVALYRPGPLSSGMVDDFVDRKHGRKKVEYPHPKLESVLKPTYGVIVYQEQVMQIAQQLAGYSLGQADLLRRAMGKKKPEEMAKQRSVFIEGSKENGVSEEKATEIFELIDYFSGYGFNKSHSAAYALIAYQTAYLKAHHPVEFMASVMSYNMKNSDKLVNFMADVAKDGHKILPPHINKSGETFLPTNKGNILYGLNAIKGVGEAACKEIIRERKENGPFSDFFNFVKRVNSSVNKVAIGGLINSGALDCFGEDRNKLFESIQNATEYRKKINEAIKNNKDIDKIAVPVYEDFEPISHKGKLDKEVESLGVYISGHPLDEYKQEVSTIVTAKNSEMNLEEHEFKETDPKYFIQVGVVVNLSKRKKITTFLLDDTNGVVNCSMFAGVAKKFEERIKNGEVMGVRGKLQHDSYTDSPTIRVSEVFSVQEMREKYGKQVAVYGDKNIFENSETMKILKQESEQHSPGYCKLLFIDKSTNEVLKLNMPNSIVPNDALLNEYKKNHLIVDIKYEGRELKVEEVKSTKSFNTETVSKEEIFGQLKGKLQRVKDLIDEAQLEKSEQVRANVLKRKREIKNTI